MALLFSWLHARYTVFASSTSRQSRVAAEFLTKHKRLIGYLAAASLTASAAFYSFRYLNRRRIERNTLAEEAKQRDALKPSLQFSEFRNRKSSNASTASTSSNKSKNNNNNAQNISYDAICKHYDAIFELDFASHTLTASVKYKLEAKKETKQVLLDMQGQKILMCMLDETELEYEIIQEGISDSNADQQQQQQQQQSKQQQQQQQQQLLIKLPGYASAGTEFEVILKYEIALPTSRRDFYLSDPVVKSTLVSQESDAECSFDLQLRVSKCVATAISYASQIANYKAEGCTILNFQLKKPSRITDRFFLAAGHANLSEVKSNPRERIMCEKGVGIENIKRVSQVLNSAVLKSLQSSPLAALLKQKPYFQEFKISDVANILIVSRDFMDHERSNLVVLSEEDTFDKSIIEEKLFQQCARALLSSFFNTTIDWTNTSTSALKRICEVIVWEMIYDSSNKEEANAYLSLKSIQPERNIFGKQQTQSQSTHATTTTQQQNEVFQLKKHQQHSKQWGLMEILKEFLSSLPTTTTTSTNYKVIPSQQALQDFTATKLKNLKKKQIEQDEPVNLETEPDSVRNALSLLEESNCIINGTKTNDNLKKQAILALSSRETRMLIRSIGKINNSSTNSNHSHSNNDLNAISLINQIKQIRSNVE